VRVERLRVRDFRSYEAAEAGLGERLTVVHGANGAGKTNLLEALYFGCTARSFRTANERELIRFGASATRVVVEAIDDDGPHELAVGFSPGEPKRLSLDGAPLERLLDAPQRPLVGVSRSSVARISISSSRRCGRLARQLGEATAKHSRSATRCSHASGVVGSMRRRCGRGTLSSRGWGSSSPPIGPARRHSSRIVSQVTPRR
jgi:recombinational DNA repair ATPase RecF